MEASSPNIVTGVGRFPSASYLAECIRAAAGMAYADSQKEETASFSCHRNRIMSAVTARLGSGLACETSREQLSELFDILADLGDLAHVGNGDYVPREFRVTRFAEEWGRISGGLPLECLNVSGELIEDHFESIPTIGRMVKLAAGSSPDDWEVAEYYFWTKASDQELYAHLLEDLSGAKCPPMADSCVFYDVGRRARTRGDRWHSRPIGSGSFAVARKAGPVASYYVILFGAKGGTAQWREVTPDDARKWILLSERIAKVKNYIRGEEGPESVVVYVPDMLPRFARVALFSCASEVVRREKGWNIEIPNLLRDFFDTVLDCSNCVIS